MHDESLVPNSDTVDNPGLIELHKVHRLRVALLVGACLAFAYLAINEVSSRLTYDVDVMTKWDQRIPFTPEWVWIYNLNIPMPLTLIIVATKAEQLLELIGGYVAIFIVAALAFVLLPVHADVLRPALALLPATWSVQMVGHYYTLDEVGNCLPSLHVAYSVYAGWWGLQLMPRRWGYPYAVLGLGITLSTMLVKQHFIADVVSALVLAAAVYIAQRYFAVSMRRFVPRPIERLVLSGQRTPSS